jgi:hypothetical protein
MSDQILEGVWSGLVRLFIFGVGYVLFSVGGHLVSEKGSGPSSTKGMPKWKAALYAPIVGVVLGFLVATPHYIREGNDPIVGGEVVDVTEVEKPYESFTCMFVFSCAAMWIGVAKANKYGASANHLKC